MKNIRIAVVSAGLLASGAANAYITLYEHDNFRGRSFGSENSVSNLEGSGLNDQVSSVVVRSGRWQLCSDAFFKGNCVTVGPGRYGSLREMGMNDRLSSARELGWTPDGQGGWQGGSGTNWGDGGNWGSGSRAVLYTGPNLTGKPYVVSPIGVTNLERTGFNDRALSLRIESGYWIFCTDANYEGDCQTYGPGDYARLSHGQNMKISSGRRISMDYPYRSRGDWSNPVKR